MNNVLQTSNCNGVRDQWIKIEMNQCQWEFAVGQRSLYQLIKVYYLKIGTAKIVFYIKNKLDLEMQI